MMIQFIPKLFIVHSIRTRALTRVFLSPNTAVRHNHPENEMDRRKYLLVQARLLASRLERISADSTWAHRSSGHRGALLRWIQEYENSPSDNQQPDDQSQERLQELVRVSYILLEQAAKEIVR